MQVGEPFLDDGRVTGSHQTIQSGMTPNNMKLARERPNIMSAPDRRSWDEFVDDLANGGG